MNDLKFINKNPEFRFVSKDELHSSYLYEPIHIDDLQLGIVSNVPNAVNYAISSILTNSIEDAKIIYDHGYLPTDVVERLQTEIVSVFGVCYLWGASGYRFVLSKQVSNNLFEIIGSALIAKDYDNIFFFSGLYNNVSFSNLENEVNFSIKDPLRPNFDWFSKFDFPNTKEYKPDGFNHLANFVISKFHRNKGYSKLLINYIINSYKHLLGKGLWQIGDPPWLKRMSRLGFSLRGGAESFYLETNWGKLRPIIKNNKELSNVEYNNMYSMPDLYNNHKPSKYDLSDRISHVIDLAKSNKAKLQYFQLIKEF